MTYIDFDVNSNGNFISLCTKLHTQGYKNLKKEREKNRKQNPEFQVQENELSDNCKGYLFLKHTKQGFDIKGSK